MNEHISPEEKLLKLIRKKDRSPVVPTAAGRKSSSFAGASDDKGGRGFFTFLEKFFIFICFILFLYIGYEFLFTEKDLKVILEEKGALLEGGDFEKIAVAEPKPYTYYTLPTVERNIFQAPYANPKGAAPVSNVPELTKNLKLVGVVLDRDSQAVIEDAEGQQTFFLKKGEQVRGAIVDEIKESKVILLFGGQRVELVQ